MSEANEGSFMNVITLSTDLCLFRMVGHVQRVCRTRMGDDSFLGKKS